MEMMLLCLSWGGPGHWGCRIRSRPFPFSLANYCAILCNLGNLFLGFKKKFYFCDAAYAET